MDATLNEILFWIMVPTIVCALAAEMDVLGAIRDHFHIKPQGHA